MTLHTPHRSQRSLRTHALLFATVIALAASCGGRQLEAGPGPDDDDDDGGGGAGGMTAVGGMGGVGGADGGMGGDGASGGQPPNPIDCLTCAAQNCPEAVGCFTDQDCLNGLVCTVGQCIAGGGPDFMCVLECFDGDLGAAQQALAAFVCISSTCGEACGDLLPF